MPAVQSTYNSRMPAAIEGMEANMEVNNIISRLVEGDAGLGFGKVAVQGTADNQVKPSAASTIFRGITVLDPAQLQDSYPEGATAKVMTKGVIWVRAGAAVTAGQPAYFVPATGVITNVSTSNTAIPNGIFDSSAASGALVKLRLG